MSDEGGFLQRWSRRKVQAKNGPVPAEAPAPALPQGRKEEDALHRPPGEGRGGGQRESPVPEDPPPPTLEDAAALPTGADIREFMSPTVDENVKRVALKKLFADPRFNLMDGLDTYIDDYSQPDPIPPGMLRKLAQSQLLGLFEDEEQAKASPDGKTPPAVPQSAPESPAVLSDENADLRLQQDDAAGRGGTGEGPAA